MNSTKNIHDVKKLFGDIYARINIQSPNDTIDDIEESISNKIDKIVNGTDDDKKNTLALIREMVNSKITGGANIGGGNRKKKRTKKYKKNRSRKMQTRTRRKMCRKPSIRRKN
jgi:hypothetical protein